MAQIVISDVKWGVPVNYIVDQLQDCFDPAFMDTTMAHAIQDRINKGELQCFCVRVQFEYQGIILATDYLSGCVYSSLNEFVTTIGYFQDMCKAVDRDAESVIRMLQRINLPTPPSKIPVFDQ